MGFFFDGHRPQPPFARIDGREPAPKRAEESYPDAGLRMPDNWLATVSPVAQPRIRSDRKGDGHFMVSRDGNRKHRGVDLSAAPHTLVRSPVNGVVKKEGQAYTDPKKAEYKTLWIEGDDGRMYGLFYVVPRDLDGNPLTTIGTRVRAGQAVGSVQDIAKAYGPEMDNHVHIEVHERGKPINPEPMVERWILDWQNRGGPW